MLQKVAAVFFSLSFFLPALIFVLLGKESGIFVTVGLAYLLTSQCILWAGVLFFERRKFRRRGWLLTGLGVVLLAAALPLHQAAERYDVWRDKQIIAAQRNTAVFDLQDEPFRSARGSVLGVRLRFAVRFPKKGRYAPTPRLLPADHGLSAFRGLTVLNAVVEPKPSASREARLPLGQYNAGDTYHFQVDMIPFYLIPANDGSGYCVSFANENEKQVAESDHATRFLISVGGTNADLYLTGNALLTSHAYNLRNFYDGAMAEGAHSSCSFDHQDK